MDASTAKAIKGRAPLRASQQLRAALKKRGKGVGSITYFHSAKNDRDIVLSSDLEFAHALFLEADETVRSYDVDPDRVSAYVKGRGYVGSRPDTLITRHTGRLCMVEVKYEQDKTIERVLIQADVQARAAAQLDADWAWFTDKDARHYERLINDWLHISPVLHQTRWDVAAIWEQLSHEVVDQVCCGPLTLAALRDRHKDSWSLVFSTAWRLVQRGLLASDLLNRPLGPGTTLTLVRGHGK